MATSEATPDQLEEAYRRGFEAGERGEDAMPGCTATSLGRAWLDGYLDAFAGGRQASRDTR